VEPTEFSGELRRSPEAVYTLLDNSDGDGLEITLEAGQEFEIHFAGDWYPVRLRSAGGHLVLVSSGGARLPPLAPPIRARLRWPGRAAQP
jgi:hypothetical protein